MSPLLRILKSGFVLLWSYVFRHTKSEKVIRFGEFILALFLIIILIDVVVYVLPALLPPAIILLAAYYLSKVFRKIRHSKQKTP
jgi:hypothetical protein